MHKLHCPFGLPKAFKAQIAFAYAGVPFEDVNVEWTQIKSPEFLKKNPNGKVPVLETPNGKFIWESNAILRYIARLDKSKGLYGKNEEEEALVDQWLDWLATNYEGDFYKAIFPHIGRALHVTKIEQKEALERLMVGLKVLEEHLKLHTFLVGNSVTLADISLAVGLGAAFRFVWDEKFRKNIPNITRWWEFVMNQTPFKGVFGRCILCKKAFDRSTFEPASAADEKPVDKEGKTEKGAKGGK